MSGRNSFSFTSDNKIEISQTGPYSIQFQVAAPEPTSTSSIMKKFKSCLKRHKPILYASTTALSAAGAAASYYWLNTVSNNYHYFLNQYINDTQCSNLTMVNDRFGHSDPCATLKLPIPSDLPYSCVGMLAKACGVTSEEAAPILASLVLTILTVQSLKVLYWSCKEKTNAETTLLNDVSAEEQEEFEPPIDLPQFVAEEEPTPKASYTPSTEHNKSASMRII